MNDTRSRKLRAAVWCHCYRNDGGRINIYNPARYAFIDAIDDVACRKRSGACGNGVHIDILTVHTKIAHTETRSIGPYHLPFLLGHVLLEPDKRARVGTVAIGAKIIASMI